MASFPPLIADARRALMNAPFEAGGWTRAVAAVAAATRSTGAHLIGMGGPLVLPLNIVSGLDSRIERYLGDPALHGAVNWRVATSGAPLTIQHEAHYAAYRQRAETAAYDDIAHDLDMELGCQSVLIATGSTFIGLAMMRSRRDGPSNGDTLAAFAALLPDVQRAIRMQLALDGEAAELMLDGPAGVRGATLLIDRHGQLCAMTPAAETALESGWPLRLDGLSPRLADPAADRDFQALLARMLGAAATEGMVDQRRVGSNGGGWQLCTMRLPAREHGLGFDPHLAISVKPLHHRATCPAGESR